MNRLQQIEFELLKEFVCICEELQLTYFLVCGSALGAAKYQGFIPWDDDVDVALPRPDYEIFCREAQKLLPEGVFLQNNRTDPEYPFIFSKLRQSNTTFVEKALSQRNINHGVYIDVFPLDGYPNNSSLASQVEKEKRRYDLWLLCCLNFKGNWKTKLLTVAEKMLLLHRRASWFVNRLERHISQYQVGESYLWCNHGNWQGKREYAPREQYGSGIWATFEGLQIRIPEKYDEYLTQKYGDWRADLPEEKKTGHHYSLICDTERTYEDYIERYSERCIRFKK